MFQHREEVRDDGKGLHFYELDDCGGEIIRVDVDEISKKCKLCHAWALTIHKFQGSEVDTILYLLSDSNPYENWQHVYTAVTRGKKNVFIIGKGFTVNIIDFFSKSNCVFFLF